MTDKCHATLFLSAEQKTSEIGIAEMECSKESGLIRTKKCLVIIRIVRQHAAMRTSIGDAKLQHERFLKDEKMPEYLACGRLASEDDAQVVA